MSMSGRCCGASPGHERERAVPCGGTLYHRFLDGEGLSVVFQPIAELAGGGVVAAEALCRFAAEPRRSPDRWFAYGGDGRPHLPSDGSQDGVDGTAIL